METHNNINHLAILVCFILLTGLGFLWYGPFFGDPWMEMVGLDAASVESNPPGAGIWITNILATVIPLYALAWIFKKMGVRSGITGAGIGLLISFSFVFLSKLTGDLFAGSPYALSWITGGYDMVALTLAGFILGAWTKRVSVA